jgi:hypothetical protein
LFTSPDDSITHDRGSRIDAKYNFPFFQLLIIKLPRNVECGPNETYPQALIFSPQCR